MVPTELLVTAMVGGFAVALTAVVAMAGRLSSRISDLRSDVSGRFDAMETRFAAVDARMGSMGDDLVTVRASLGAIDARLTTLER